MDAQFATIGHSNRSIAEFVGMLREARVDVVADVRAFPRSRANPAFNAEHLVEDLGQVQIGYRHFPSLGGRRSRQAAADEGINGLWRVRSFHNYADYALGDEFAAGLEELVRLGCGHRPALMCAEAVWWRCHRRIVADYLLLNGHTVVHLMGPGRTEQAVPTPGARRTGDGKVIYPRAP